MTADRLTSPSWLGVPLLILCGVLLTSQGVGSEPAAAFLAQAAPPRKSAMPPVGKGNSILRGAPEGAGEGSGSAGAGASTRAGEEANSGGGQASQGGGAGVVQEITRFIRTYATWIIAALGVTFVALVGWTLIGARGKKGGDGGGLEDLGLGDAGESPAASAAKPRYSSTKIQKADVTVGLTGTVTTTQVETDREYALVVDEEALKKPPLPEDSSEAAGRTTGDTNKIRELLAAGKPVPAYEEFVRQVKGNPRAPLPRDVEVTLGECLMEAREFEKAAKVLEHHVATQPREGIRSDVFFNLGYVHFMNRSANKARRFFKAFLQVEKNPEYLARARKILDKLGPAAPTTRA